MRFSVWARSACGLTLASERRGVGMATWTSTSTDGRLPEAAGGEEVIVDGGEEKVERVGPFGASSPAPYARPVWEGYGIVMEGVSWCAETVVSPIYHAYEAGCRLSTDPCLDSGAGSGNDAAEDSGSESDYDPSRNRSRNPNPCHWSLCHPSPSRNQTTTILPLERRVAVP